MITQGQHLMSLNWSSNEVERLQKPVLLLPALTSRQVMPAGSPQPAGSFCSCPAPSSLPEFPQACY